MQTSAAPVRIPDLSSRPFNLSVECALKLSVSVLFRAWTEGFDQWFADPGSVLMRPEVNAPFFFETVYRPEDHAVAQRHPHYGRFLEIRPERVVELTWVTGAGGTEGAETIVRVEFDATSEGSHVRLTHRGFPNEQSRDRHAQAWPHVLEQMERHLAEH
jgi:uncharacterized protein YndB with AHSA1/START domain